MKVFGFISGKYDTGFLVKLLHIDGHLINALEIYQYDKIKEVSQKFCPKDCDYEWLDAPWNNNDFKMAVKNYEEIYGCSFRGNR